MAFAEVECGDERQLNVNPWLNWYLSTGSCTVLPRLTLSPNGPVILLAQTDASAKRYSC